MFDYLAAFWKRYCCNHTLLKLREEYKEALDSKMHVGAVMVDLSKAFDFLSQVLLLSKMHAHGVSVETCLLIKDYLQNKRQRVEIGSCRSEWLNATKGVPQGSTLGPLLIFLESNCSYNCADDSTISVCHQDINIVMQRLRDCTNASTSWFTEKSMQANPSKFQAIIIQHGQTQTPVHLDISGIDLLIRPCGRKHWLWFKIQYPNFINL